METLLGWLPTILVVWLLIRWRNKRAASAVAASHAAAVSEARGGAGGAGAAVVNVYLDGRQLVDGWRADVSYVDHDHDRALHGTPLDHIDVVDQLDVDQLDDDYDELDPAPHDDDNGAGVVRGRRALARGAQLVRRGR